MNKIFPKFFPSIMLFADEKHMKDRSKVDNICEQEVNGFLRSYRPKSTGGANYSGVPIE